MNLVQKYVGTSDRNPRITGLGGHDWEKQRVSQKSNPGYSKRLSRNLIVTNP